MKLTTRATGREDEEEGHETRSPCPGRVMRIVDVGIIKSRLLLADNGHRATGKTITRTLTNQGGGSSRLIMSMLCPYWFSSHA